MRSFNNSAPIAKNGALLLILLFACCCHCHIVNMPATENATLLAAYWLIVPGSSSPDYPVPSLNWSDWPDERAPHRLTAVGMREQFLLGASFRDKYSQLLKNTALWQGVRIRTINTNESIASSQAFIAGFVGSKETLLSEEEQRLALPPVSIDPHILATLRDRVLPYGIPTFPFHSHYPVTEDFFDVRSCKRANEMYADTVNFSGEAFAVQEKFKDRFYQIIKDAYNLSQEAWEYPRYIPLLNSIVIADRQGRDTRIRLEDIEYLRDFAKELYFFECCADEVANTLRFCEVLPNVVREINLTVTDRMRGKRSQEVPRLQLAFVSEEVVTSLLYYAGLDLPLMLPPSAGIGFELFGPEQGEINKARDDFYVKFRYNDRELRFSYCAFPICSFKEFMTVVSETCQKFSELYTCS